MQTSIHNPHFLLRRLHSLLGLLPAGGFLIFHLWENSQSRFGATYYNDQVVGWLQGLNYLVLLEIFMIALPLLFHAGYGLVILRSGQGEWRRFSWLHHRLYWLQRVSGVAILLFLLFHVGWTRIWAIWEPAIKLDLFGHMQALLIQPTIFLLYLTGLLLSLFHLSNGLWTMAISWGLTTSAAAQQRWLYICAGLFVLLTALGLHGMLGFVL
ncbi:MAG: succinate dehydrogenase [Candidatus Thiodiazotropha sp. (ex Notomyrtea botanica)]|nr:succinate dehydrogenase [Candidatus Thiodiazotropha sp. (ex Notomyrtea botanica)]